ncbi:MAG: LptF/LptG family permease, partial [Candidatus Bipolaricaulota bacterium]
MVRRVDRYLWGELLGPFGVALLAFLVFIGLELVLSLSDVFLARGVGAGTMLRLLSFKLPSLLTFALPAGVLLATFLALGRLVSDRELLALQAVGYSIRRLLVPFVLFGVAVSVLSFTLGELVVPAAESAYREQLLTVLYRGEVPALQEDVFFRGQEGELYYIQSYKGDRALGVVVYDLQGRVFPPEGRFPTVLTAEQGQLRGGDLAMQDGRLLRFGSDGALEEMARFEALTLEVGEDVQQAVLGGQTPGEMSMRELSQRIELFERSGLDPRNLVVEYHSKLAVIAAGAVFALLGAPLGVLLGRRGRAVAAIAGFALVAGAQGMLIWSRTMARREMLPASLGGWLPHIVLVVLGVTLLLFTDRRRVRGAGAVLLAVALGVVGWAAEWPFEEITAQRLVIGPEADSVAAEEVSAVLRGYELTAGSLEGVREEDGWSIEAEGARLVGADMEMEAAHISARFDHGGRLKEAVAEEFQGSSSFTGPEKEEILRYYGEWGRAAFAGGALTRLEARDVRFTTCPCLDDAPYRVDASRFVLLPERWLYASRVTVWSFGVPAGWLPVYAARLGEEATPLFPEVGREGEHWFLRWHVPWALGEEGLWGAVGVTWFPWAGVLRPVVDVLWDTGELRLAPDRAVLSSRGEFQGGSWRIGFDVSEDHFSAEARGDLGPWEWSALWGRVEEDGELIYEQAPHLTLSGRADDWLGGALTLRVDTGRFREEGRVGTRSGTTLSWTRGWELGPFDVQTPWRVGVDLYEEGHRMACGVNPGLSLGGLELSYRGQVSVGHSPFEFDAAPPESRLAVSLAGSSEDWSQRLSLGWDFVTGASLPGTWSLQGPKTKLDVQFSPAPLEIRRSTWELAWAEEQLRLSLRGGLAMNPVSWDDVLIRGSWAPEVGSVNVGFRLGLDPLSVKRSAGEVAWELGDDWSVRAWGEFDWDRARWVQLGSGVSRLFEG